LQKFGKEGSLPPLAALAQQHNSRCSRNLPITVNSLIFTAVTVRFFPLTAVLAYIMLHDARMAGLGRLNAATKTSSKVSKPLL
jgi:hypothetical protein